MTTTTDVRAIRTAPEGLPEITLGWDVLQWTSDFLLQPDGPDAGEPWKFTNEQARFVLNWYAIDERGRFTHRYGVYRRMKGAGKTPLAAAICCAEFLGPCRFKEFGDQGQPIAVEHEAAWIQAAATSRDQTRNLSTLFPGMLSRKAIEQHALDIGKEIIYAHQGRRRLEVVTSSPRALEGQRPTFYLADETHLWRANNEGHSMMGVIARNVAKSRDGAARVLATTNAHAPGEDSVAERDYEAWRKDAADMLYDSLEAPDGIDLEDTDAVRKGVLAARGDSDWLSEDRLTKEIQDPRTMESEARRFYLNQIWASEDRPFDLKAWTDGHRPDYMPDAGALISLGFDGSRGEDATAIVATEVSTGFQWLAGLWERPRNRQDWEVPRAEVDAKMRELFASYTVWRLTADDSGWDETFRRWAGDFGKNAQGQHRVVKFSMADVTQARMIMAFDVAMRSGELTHGGDIDAAYTRHVGNSIKKRVTRLDEDGFPLWRIYKERWDSPNKIDAAMAGGMSWDGRLAAIEAGALNDSPTEVWFLSDA
jgi:hypothetical protein